VGRGNGTDLIIRTEVRRTLRRSSRIRYGIKYDERKRRLLHRDRGNDFGYIYFQTIVKQVNMDMDNMVIESYLISYGVIFTGII
jgi:hypothetical protein